MNWFVKYWGIYYNAPYYLYLVSLLLQLISVIVVIFIGGLLYWLVMLFIWSHLACDKLYRFLRDEEARENAYDREGYFDVDVFVKEAMRLKAEIIFNELEKHSSAQIVKFVDDCPVYGYETHPSFYLATKEKHLQNSQTTTGEQE